jgi:hypothetical protein
MTPDEYQRLDPIQSSIVDSIVTRLPGINAQMVLSDRLIIRIPAQSMRVGPLEIWVQSDVVTIFVGDHAHARFGPWPQPMGPGELGHTASNEVVGFIEDVMADRIVIWSSRRDSQTVEGGTYLREHDLGALGASADAEHFVWSGRPVSPSQES